MNRANHRQHRRWRKAIAYGKLLIGGVMIAPAWMGVPAFLLLALIALAEGAASGWSTVVLVIVFVLCLGGAAMMGMFARWTQRAASEGYHEIVGEVVKDNIDQIPVARMLVRGTQKPAAPDETLLRPARDDGKTRDEELLRSHEGS